MNYFIGLHILLATNISLWFIVSSESLDLASECKSYREKYTTPPNIVYIMADDLGWNDVGFRNSKIKTPNIDKLKARGIELTQSYMQPSCSASRSSFMTGKYPSNNGLQLLVLMSASQSCLPIEHKTIYDHMREEGYVTKHLGKWHLGDCDESCLPQARGIDEFRGILSGRADYFNWTMLNGVQRQVDGEPSVDNIGVHLTVLDKSDARDMILNHKDNPKPLFMCVSPTAPHEPLQSTEDMFNVHDVLDAKDPDENKRRIYLGLVSALDDVVGETLAAIDEAGMKNNTIIVFTSDNGGAGRSSSYYPYELFSNNYPLRNGKGSFTEGGIRVPTIYYDPRLDRSTEGTKRDFLVHVTDWLPTLVQVAKQGKIDQCSSIPGIDGVSQLVNLQSAYDLPLERKYRVREDMLVGLTEAGTSHHGYSTCATEDAAYRWRDFKLIYGKNYSLVDPDTKSTEWPKPEESPELPNITGDRCHRMVDGERVVRCLFNVIDDPSETINLFDEEPDIVETILEKIEEARKVSVKPVYQPPLTDLSLTSKPFGNYTVPRHDYCVPSIHFPLLPNDPECYKSILEVDYANSQPIQSVGSAYTLFLVCCFLMVANFGYFIF